MAIYFVAYDLTKKKPEFDYEILWNELKRLALQLFLPASSESMGNHDSDIVDADGVG